MVFACIAKALSGVAGVTDIGAEVLVFMDNYYKWSALNCGAIGYEMTYTFVQ